LPAGKVTDDDDDDKQNNTGLLGGPVMNVWRNALGLGVWLAIKGAVSRGAGGSTAATGR